MEHHTTTPFQTRVTRDTRAPRRSTRAAHAHADTPNILIIIITHMHINSKNTEDTRLHASAQRKTEGAERGSIPRHTPITPSSPSF
eukprot:scaffold291059_cov32-Tisochrysis_lutea.AAC.1